MPSPRKMKTKQTVDTTAQSLPEERVLTDEQQISITISYLASSLENLGREGIHPWNALNAMAMVCGRAIPELLGPGRVQEALQQLHGRMIQEMRNKVAQQALASAKAMVATDEA